MRRPTHLPNVVSTCFRNRSFCPAGDYRQDIRGCHERRPPGSELERVPDRRIADRVRSLPTGDTNRGPSTADWVRPRHAGDTKTSGTAQETAPCPRPRGSILCSQRSPDEMQWDPGKGRASESPYSAGLHTGYGCCFRYPADVHGVDKVGVVKTLLPLDVRSTSPPMPEANNFDCLTLRVDAVNHSVRTDYDFPDNGIAKLWHQSTHLRELYERFRLGHQQPAKLKRAVRCVERDVTNDLLKITACGRG